ncbi:MAG: DUF4349 domain-containing protein [Bacteroidia bacterium]|nr:DUF4349 domain-containing protein [Bacteroidia bacterium]
MLKKNNISLFFLVLLTACDGGGGSSSAYSPRTESNGSKQVLSAYLEIVPHRWEGTADSVEKWTFKRRGQLLRKEKTEERLLTYSIRIPTAHAGEFIQEVRTLGEIINEHTSLTDITREYADIEARLKAKEEAVARLKELLRQARTASEILEAEKALQQALSERDELRSQYETGKALSESIQIDLTLRNRLYVEYSQGGSYWNQLLRSIKSGWEGFVYFTFAIAYLWWLWLITGLLILTLRWIARRSKKNAAGN